MRDRLRILVSGMVAGVPFQGGATWAVLQYVIGLGHLGHDVWLIEPVEPAALRAAPDGVLRRSDCARYFQDTMAEFGLTERSAMVLTGTDETIGVAFSALRDASRTADLLINVAGMLKDERLVESVPVRAYLDLDPTFTQLWTSQGIDMGLPGHTYYVTVGLAIGSKGCGIPTCGQRWITTLPPVVLDSWPVVMAPARRDAFTTVANWRSYGPIEHEGMFYGQKGHSFRTLMSLPARVSDTFVVALSIHADETGDLAALDCNGWQLLDPREAVASPSAYRGFIQDSSAELGVAKGGYVASRCGWFSDRSAAYLASGRPVLAQDTGFSRFLPTEWGLLAFDDLESAVQGVHAVRGDYERHAVAARCVAEEYFDSDKVLGQLLDRLGMRV